MSPLGVVLLVLLVLLLAGGFAIHAAGWLFILAVVALVLFCVDASRGR